MRNLLDFLKRYLYWLVFLVLEVVSLVSLFEYNSYQGSVFFSTANSVVGSINQFSSDFTSYFHLKEENEILEKENEQLRSQLVAAKTYIADIKATAADTTEFLNGIRSTYHTIGAKVISSTLHRAKNLITIDRGRADGVAEEMAVVCSSGVVGVVYTVSEHYAIVLPLLNENSKISCRLDSTHFFGTMQWQYGNPNISYMNGVPRHSTVKIGSMVETNGYSDIFPEGIPVGKVTKIGDSPDGMSYILTVKLCTDFKSLRNVSVITDYSNEERHLLELQTDSIQP